MLIKGLLFSVAATAHFWLWGQWSLEASMRTSILLVTATLIFLFLVVYPIRLSLRGGPWRTVFHQWWMQALFYTYLLLVIVMGILSFKGLIQFLLPIIVLLLGLSVFLKYRFKKTSPAQR